MNLLIEFLKHNTMMNTKLIDACDGLNPDQLDTSVEGTYGKLGATLVHIANAQDAYAARFFGDVRPVGLAESPFPGAAAVRQRLAESNARLESAAAIVDDGREVQVTGDDPVGAWSMPGALLLLQVVNHGTEHRSQVATILTQIGTEPPAMDGWTYFFDGGHMAEVHDSTTDTP